MEVEAAFFIGLVSAVNYLAFSRFLELVNIDDMVRARTESANESTCDRKQPSCVFFLVVSFFLHSHGCTVL